MSRRSKPLTGGFLSLWAGGALCLFLLLVFCLLNDLLAPFDSWVYTRVAGFISPGLTPVVVFITHLGGDRALIAAAVAVFLLLLWRKGLLLACVAAANQPLASLLNELLKLVFLRPRPNILRLVEEPGYSFPSGHSFAAMAFYGMLIVLVLRLLPKSAQLWLTISLGLLILAIGLSRIYVGVHYASDVLAGLCGGFVWLTLYRRVKHLWPRLPL